MFAPFDLLAQGPETARAFLARVAEADIENAGAYTYWDGNSWAGGEASARLTRPGLGDRAAAASGG